MASTIKHIRTSVAGRIPSASDLELGELGINTTDGKVFIKKDVSGTETIVDIGGGPQTAAEILAAVKTVDGTGSGLDADTLDGQEGSHYLNYSNLTNKPTIPTNNNQLTNGAGYVTSNTQLSTEQVQDIAGAMVSGNTESGITVTYQDSDGTLDFTVASQTDQNFTNADHSKLDGIESGATADQTKADIDALNINADKLDGQHGAYYTGYTDTAIANLVDSSPGALDTLNELAAALGDDANFSTTVTNSIATKLPKSGGQMTGNITFSGSQTVDGRDLSADGSKLDGIESGATADQNAAEIRTLVESASDSNVFTDADHSKLNGIASGATNVTNNNQLTNGAGYVTSNTQLSNEQVQDIVGGMVSSNTESGITVTYQDADGTLDFSVASQTDQNFTNADHSKLNGIESGATADQTAAEILTAIKTVDGSGSGLDADTLDGIGSGSFLRSDAADSFSGALTGGGTISVTGGKIECGRTSGSVAMTINDGYGNANLCFNHSYGIPDVSGSACRIESGVDGTTGFINFEVGNSVTANTAVSLTDTLRLTTSAITFKNNTVWHAGNDGSGSGLDSDLLDGQHGSYYTNYNNLSNKPTVSDPLATTSTLAVGQSSAASNTQLDLNGGYAQTVVAVSGTSVDCSSGNYFTKTISSNTTFSFTNVPSSRAYSFTLELTHNGGTASWPSSVKFPADTAPTLTTGKTHLFIFVTDNGGSRWRAAALADYVN